MRSLLTKHKYFLKQRASGFTMVEILLGLGLGSLIAIMIGSYVTVTTKARKDASRTMALDAVERQITNIMTKVEIIEASIREAHRTSPLKGEPLKCFIQKQGCEHGSSRQSLLVPIIMYQGSKVTPVTGPKAQYSEEGELCGARCNGIEVATRIIPMCHNGVSCSGPDYYLVRNLYDLPDINHARRSGAKRIPERNRVQEVRRTSATDLFPNLTMACPYANSVLAGISLTGKPICTPVGQMIAEDPENRGSPGTFRITPKDCSAIGYVSEIKDPSGEIVCSQKFW